MKIKQTLGAILLTGAIGLTGCYNKPSTPESIYLDGVVKREAGSVAQIVESSGALFGNESVKFSNPTYLLQIETLEGIYTASVVQSWCGNSTLEGLALVIQEGSKVKFAKKHRGNDRFGKDRIGKIYSDELTVLDNQ